MNQYIESPEWIYQKCGGKLYAVTPQENTRLMSLEKEYKRYSDVPVDFEFDANELVKNEKGDHYCNWKYPIKLLVHKIEPFIALIKGN